MKLSAAASDWVTRGLIAVFLLIAAYAVISRIPVSSSQTPGTGAAAPAVPTVATIPNVATQEPILLSIPAKIDWNAKDNGENKSYAVGDFSIKLSSGKDKDGTVVPVIDVDYPGHAHIRAQGQPGFDIASAKVELLELGLAGSAPALIFISYSGGAHCCTTAEIYQPINGQWAHDVVGGDGEPFEELPKDVDGDKIIDIELSDGQFLYTFASYAESHPPPVFFNFVGGKLENVSSSPRYFNIFRRVMLQDQADCLLHSNGACAAFVAIASRLGLHDWAWEYAMENYDESAKWEYPAACDIDPGKNPCPEDHKHTKTFPNALEKFIVETGYWNVDDQSERDLLRPGFDCGAVTSQVLSQICTNKTLAGLDRTLSAAYYAAKQTSSFPDVLKGEQVNWISDRNNGSSDPGTLETTYKLRIGQLTTLARQQAEAQTAKLSAGGR